MTTYVEYHRWEQPPYEAVERKGPGHPDSLADSVSEAVSRGLCQAYMEEFGTVLHHNVDKVLIIAGESQPEYGGGEIIKPMTIVIGGRATREFQGKKIPMEEIAIGAAEDVLRERAPRARFIVDPRMGAGSPELRDLLEEGPTRSNDTSIGVGFAPYTPVEATVYRAEELARNTRGVGEDVKIMGIRQGERLQLVVAAATVSEYVHSHSQYHEVLDTVRERVEQIDWPGELEVIVNAADRGDDIYLTVTGTSAEMGDDGATGRGNRLNGLITPGRPMTIEAPHGKNPVNHVGKIYNILAQHISEDIADMRGVDGAEITLVSEIGAPLEEPLLRGARVYGHAPENQIKEVFDYWLENTAMATEEFIWP